MPSFINDTRLDLHDQHQTSTAHRDHLVHRWRPRRWSCGSMPDPGPRAGIDFSPYAPLSLRQWEPVPSPMVNRMAIHTHSRLSPRSKPFQPRRPTSSTMPTPSRTVIESEYDLPGNMNLNVQYGIPNETLSLIENNDFSIPLRSPPLEQMQAIGPLQYPAPGYWDSLWRYNVALLYPIHLTPQWTQRGLNSMLDWRFHHLAETILARMGRFVADADIEYDLLDPLEWINIMIVPSYGEEDNNSLYNIDVGLLWVKATNAGWRVMTLSTFEQQVMLCDEHAKKLFTCNLPLPRSGLPVVEPYLGIVENLVSSQMEDPYLQIYQNVILTERINCAIPITRPEVASPTGIQLGLSPSPTNARPSYESQITESPTLVYYPPVTSQSEKSEVYSIDSPSSSHPNTVSTPDDLSVTIDRVEGARSASPVFNVSSRHIVQPSRGTAHPPLSNLNSPLSRSIPDVETKVEQLVSPIPIGERTEVTQSPSVYPLSFSAEFWSALDSVNFDNATTGSSSGCQSGKMLPLLRSRQMVNNQNQIGPIIMACGQILDKHWNADAMRVAEGVIALIKRNDGDKDMSTDERNRATAPFRNLSKHDWVPVMETFKSTITRRLPIYTENNIRGESRLIISFISDQLDAALKRPTTISEARKFVAELDELPSDRRAGKCVKTFDENVHVFLALHAGYLVEDLADR